MGKDGHSLVENSTEKLSSDLKDETVRLHNKLKMQKVELSNMISDCQTENSAREKETTLLKTTVYELKQEVAKMAKHNQRQQLPEKEIIENEELSQLKRKINYLELEVATLALCKKTMQVEIDEMTSEIKKVTQNIPEQPEMEPNEQQSMNTPNEGIRAFKGGEDPLSNFYTCTLRRVQNGKLLTFRSSEHSYQYAKAEHHHDETCMALIITSLEPREAKKHGDGITDDVNWTNSREKILEEILLDKMMQSEEFRKELEKSQGMLLAEATRDTFWATGIDGVQATQSSNPQQWAGQNKMGKILKKIQNILPEKAQTPPAYNISTNNRYEILNTQVNTSRKSADLPPNNPKPSNSARGVERRKQTPNASEQDILYIHDSTAKDIDPFKTFGSNSKGLRKRAKTLEVATDFVKEAEGEFKNLVLQVGTNDIANAPQGNISQVLDNVEKLVDAAKRNFAHMQVHLCSILPRRDIRRDTDINTFNSYIRDIANTQERVHYIETFKAFEAQLDRNLEKNRGLHPTKSGVITLGLAMRREFAAACRTGPQQRYAPNRSSAEGGHMREAPQNGGGHTQRPQQDHFGRQWQRKVSSDSADQAGYPITQSQGREVIHQRPQQPADLYNLPNFAPPPKPSLQAMTQPNLQWAASPPNMNNASMHNGRDGQQISEVQQSSQQGRIPISNQTMHMISPHTSVPSMGYNQFPRLPTPTTAGIWPFYNTVMPPYGQWPNVHLPMNQMAC